MIEVAVAGTLGLSALGVAIGAAGLVERWHVSHLSRQLTHRIVVLGGPESTTCVRLLHVGLNAGAVRSFSIDRGRRVCTRAPDGSGWLRPVEGSFWAADLAMAMRDAVRERSAALVTRTPPGEAEWITQRLLRPTIVVDLEAHEGSRRQGDVGESAVITPGEVDGAAIAQAHRALSKGFFHRVSPTTLAMALAVCHRLGVSEAVALPPMRAAPPDESASSSWLLDHYGRQVRFSNAWGSPHLALKAWLDARRTADALSDRVLLLSCDVDDLVDTLPLIAQLRSWPDLRRIIVVGGAAQTVAAHLVAYGINPRQIDCPKDEDWFERALELSARDLHLVGVGALNRVSTKIVRFFKNRGRLQLIEPDLGGQG
jgi:hypothetical protein